MTCRRNLVTGVLGFLQVSVGARRGSISRMEVSNTVVGTRSYKTGMLDI